VILSCWKRKSNYTQKILPKEFERRTQIERGERNMYDPTFPGKSPTRKGCESRWGLSISGEKGGRASAQRKTKGRATSQGIRCSSKNEVFWGGAKQRELLYKSQGGEYRPCRGSSFLKRILTRASFERRRGGGLTCLRRPSREWGGTDGKRRRRPPEQGASPRDSFKQKTGSQRPAINNGLTRAQNTLHGARHK